MYFGNGISASLTFIDCGCILSYRLYIRKDISNIFIIRITFSIRIIYEWGMNYMNNYKKCWNMLECTSFMHEFRPYNMINYRNVGVLCKEHGKISGKWLKDSCERPFMYMQRVEIKIRTETNAEITNKWNTNTHPSGYK